MRRYKRPLLVGGVKIGGVKITVGRMTLSESIPYLPFFSILKILVFCRRLHDPLLRCLLVLADYGSQLGKTASKQASKDLNRTLVFWRFQCD